MPFLEKTQIDLCASTFEDKNGVVLCSLSLILFLSFWSSICSFPESLVSLLLIGTILHVYFVPNPCGLGCFLELVWLSASLSSTYMFGYSACSIWCLEHKLLGMLPRETHLIYCVTLSV